LNRLYYSNHTTVLEYPWKRKNNILNQFSSMIWNNIFMVWLFFKIPTRARLSCFRISQLLDTIGRFGWNWRTFDENKWNENNLQLLNRFFCFKMLRAHVTVFNRDSVRNLVRNNTPRMTSTVIPKRLGLFYRNWRIAHSKN
jgi:hypothetical protein